MLLFDEAVAESFVLAAKFGEFANVWQIKINNRAVNCIDEGADSGGFVVLELQLEAMNSPFVVSCDVIEASTDNLVVGVFARTFDKEFVEI